MRFAARQPFPDASFSKKVRLRPRTGRGDVRCARNPAHGPAEPATSVQHRTFPTEKQPNVLNLGKWGPGKKTPGG